MSGSSFKRLKWSFQAAAWLAMRISGIVLLFLAGLSIYQVEIITGIENITAQWLEHRWSNPLWKGIDFLTSFLVISHGLNGLRYLLYETIHLHPLRRLVNVLLVIVGIVAVFSCGLVIF